MITLSSTEKKGPVPPLLRIGDVAKLLSVSPQTVRSLIDNGELSASNVNARNSQRQHRRVTRKSLLSFYYKRFKRPLNRDLENPITA